MRQNFCLCFEINILHLLFLNYSAHVHFAYEEETKNGKVHFFTWENVYFIVCCLVYLEDRLAFNPDTPMFLDSVINCFNYTSEPKCSTVYLSWLFPFPLVCNFQETSGLKQSSLQFGFVFSLTIFNEGKPRCVGTELLNHLFDRTQTLLISRLTPKYYFLCPFSTYPILFFLHFVSLFCRLSD